jgi:hypothetical protein
MQISPFLDHNYKFIVNVDYFDMSDEINDFSSLLRFSLIGGKFSYDSTSVYDNVSKEKEKI